MDYMTADEMAEAKHKADMDDKMKDILPGELPGELPAW